MSVFIRDFEMPKPDDKPIIDAVFAYRKGKPVLIIFHEDKEYEYPVSPISLSPVIIEPPTTIDADGDVFQGRWQRVKCTIDGNFADGYDFLCSACHKLRFHNGEMRRIYKYCPNCGARMINGGTQDE